MANDLFSSHPLTVVKAAVWITVSILCLLKKFLTASISQISNSSCEGDIEFGNNLRTENGADIDGYIKKTNSSKSKLTGDFLFKKKDKKDTTETAERADVVNNKEAIA